MNVRQRTRTGIQAHLARVTGLTRERVRQLINEGLTPEQIIARGRRGQGLRKGKARDGKHGRLVIFRGRAQTINRWALEWGVSHATARRRLARGEGIDPHEHGGRLRGEGRIENTISMLPEYWLYLTTFARSAGMSRGRWIERQIDVARQTMKPNEKTPPPQ